MLASNSVMPVRQNRTPSQAQNVQAPKATEAPKNAITEPAPKQVVAKK